MDFLTHEALDYTLLAALILAGIHFIGPLARRTLQERHGVATSFGGGLALAYVFLQLLPEVEAGHEWMGDEIHFITLGSFLGFFALEVRLKKRHAAAVLAGNQERETAVSFWLHVAITWIYTWLVVFTFPGEVAETLGLALAGSLAIGVHMVYKNYTLHTHHEGTFIEQGRWVLALAPIAGWMTRSAFTPSEAMFDVSIAILSGFLMQSVFLDELPRHDHTRLGWMVAGVLVLSALILTVP